MSDVFTASAGAEDLSLPTVAAPDEVGDLPYVAAPAEPSARGELRAKAIFGSMWTMIGYGSNIGLRIFSSAILTRLLVPEIFGVMQLVNVFFYGLNMFSDMGIGPAIIQNERGDDPTFLNTAWSLQVMRGFVLFLASLPLAWIVSRVYSIPDMRVFLPMAGVTAIIQGFLSTRIFTCSRHMLMGRLTLVEIGTRAFTIVVTVTLAYHWRSVWPLVIGTLIGDGLMRTVLSHVALPGKPNRFAWDPTALHSLVHFGRWITLSTTVFFLSRQSDRLIMCWVMPLSAFAIYAMAMQLSEVAETLVIEIVHKVMYPAYSKVARHEPERLAEVFYRSRLHLDAIFITGTGVLAMMGPWLVHQIYGRDYWAAGTILQILCIRVAISCVLYPVEGCLIALGHSKFSFIRNVARAAAILIGVPLGWHFFGAYGVYWAVALSEVPPAIVMFWKFSQHKLTRPSRELLVFVFAAAGVGIGLLLVHLLPPHLVFDLMNWVRTAILHKPPKTFVM